MIEALFSGAATQGEKVAAEQARERILERLRLMATEETPVEYRFSMADMWARKVFVALLRRYGIKPYRYSRQRDTMVMARVSKRFVDETLWPEFQEISETLRNYLSEITDRVVSQVIHQDSSEAEVVKEQAMIPSGNGDPATGLTCRRQLCHNQIKTQPPQTIGRYQSRQAAEGKKRNPKDAKKNH